MTASLQSKRRRAARLSAVQALYQMDIGEESSNTVIFQFLNHRFEQSEDRHLEAVDTEFFEALVKGVVQFQDDIDNKIANHLSEKWTIKRLDLTLRAIMRAGSFEILRRPDVPALVIIDEYVSITSDFFDGGKEPGFVNGAMDKMAKSVRAAEFGLTGGMTA